MREVITKILMVAFAIACIAAIAYPAIMNDGGKVKNRVTTEYTKMFQ